MQPKKGLDLFATIFQVETFILSVFMCEMLITFVSDGVLNVAFSKKSFQISSLMFYLNMHIQNYLSEPPNTCCHSQQL